MEGEVTEYISTPVENSLIRAKDLWFYIRHRTDRVWRKFLQSGSYDVPDKIGSVIKELALLELDYTSCVVKECEYVPDVVDMVFRCSQKRVNIV